VVRLADCFLNETKFKQVSGEATFNGNTFRVLASDWDMKEGDTAQSAHPDRRDGIMNPWILASTSILSIWANRDVAVRGPVDLHYLMADGSVKRLQGVTMDDPRLEKVPYSSFETGTTPTYMQLPAN
jgi:hypothetical protein|tara:strand:+ start:99 stop:479 length:381 start_codon:yes stop_codon:yes gene_type:complete